MRPWRGTSRLRLSLFRIAFLLIASQPDAWAAEPHRYALSMFHFNIQYVPGGLVGFVPLFPPDSSLTKSWELDNNALEDRIVTESFEPVLDLYLAHPGWGVDLEFQGYFLEVVAARHPRVLDKVKSLVASGQAELVSFHYSDQIFLAYPREDWARSQALTRAVFERVGLPLSKTVFCQEGQAGIGMAHAMPERGYGILVWPVNLFRYQHGEPGAAPFYRLDGVDMVIGSKGVAWSDGDLQVQTEWTFLDDGETLASAGWDPYFTPFFYNHPEAVAEYEREVADLEARGYSVSTVGRYVDEVKRLGVPAAEPPPLLDGTWQPKDTDGIRRWFGGIGLWNEAERDNDARTLDNVAHRELVAAETIARATEIDRTPLDGAWRLLHLAEVSDASGINPYRGEVEYGVHHAAEAMRIAREVIEEAKRRRHDSRVVIDVAADTVEDARGERAAETEIAPPFKIRVDAGGRNVTERWIEVAPGRTKVEVAFSPGADFHAKKLAVTFPGDLKEIVYCPGLDEDRPARVPKNAFSFDHYQLALANGLIGLSARRFVAKDTARVHVAATVTPDSGNVTFSDDTAPADEPVTWAFHLVEGTLDEAVEYANRLNVSPRLVR